MPGQDLLPAPKGINSKSFPLKSLAPGSKNLEGLNAFGSSHAVLSRPIAHVLITTGQQAGIKYPANMVSLAVSWKTRGIGGWRRRVSLSVHLRYVRFSRSESWTLRHKPTTFESSAWTFLSSSGFFISSVIAHSITEATVSVPPIIISCVII